MSQILSTSHVSQVLPFRSYFDVTVKSVVFSLDKESDSCDILRY